MDPLDQLMAFGTPPLPPDRWRSKPPPPGRLSATAIFWRVVAGAIVGSVGSFIGWLWLEGADLRCNDWCGHPGDSWRNSPDSWQWTAMGWLGAACLASSLACAISLRKRRAWLSLALLTTAFATGVAPFFLQSA